MDVEGRKSSRTGKAASYAKVTRPTPTHVVNRIRLFHSLDACRERSVIWISAPAGSGKTTLAASWLDARKLPCLWYQVDEGDGDIASFFYYMGLAAKKAAPRYRKPMHLLTPEYLQGIPVFTRRYFEELFSRIKSPAILVFDNYQNAPSRSGFHEMFAHALETIPEGITVVVLSRTVPPPQLSRMQANNAIYLLEWRNLQFTLPETKDLLKTQGGKDMSSADLTRLHAKTEGWAAGLILLLARDAFGKGGGDFSSVTDGKVFDYFASEIFDKADGLTQHLLLATAYLPNVTAAMAEQLTGIKESGAILEDLSRRHYFTQKHLQEELSYQYHALFREFLIARAKDYFDAAEQVSIKRKAAALLQAAGRIEDAASLLIDAKEWSALTHLINRAAQSLVAQGRSKTLEGWIAALPDDLASNNGWLQFWLGVCRISFNPILGRSHFEKAFHIFREQGDRTGTLLAWSETTNAFIVSWSEITPLDSWIDWFYRQPAMQSFPTPEIEARCASSMTGAMVWRQPQHHDIGSWVERALATTRRVFRPELRMQACINAMYYYLWTGDIPNAILISDELKTMAKAPEVSPLALITSKWIEAALATYLAEEGYETVLQAVADALKMSEDYGIHVWDHMVFGFGVHAAMYRGDREMALKFLNRMQAMLATERIQGYCHYHHVVAWYHAVFGDMATALSQAELSVKLAVEIRGTGLYFPEIFCRIGLANILCDTEDFVEAERQLEFAYDQAMRARSNMLLFMHGMVKARLAFGLKRDSEGHDILRSAMMLGRRNCFTVMFWWWQRPVMAELCRRALDAGIETEYAIKIIRTHNLLPSEAVYSEHWPYRIRIYTLGNFRIDKDGERLTFPGKVQKKPLELLKAIIALGGIDVSEERISEALWPDVDGDLAHKSVENNLGRLRKLLGEDRAIILRDGRLSIDPRFCWTDIRVFEKLRGDVETAMRSAKHDEGARFDLLKKAANLYHGNFLDGDDGLTWALSRREALKSKYLKVLQMLACHDEGEGRIEKAVEYYHRGIEIDPLTEEFSRNLMLCYIKLGREAEAVREYRRCKKALAGSLGISPSSSTEAIYRQLTSRMK